MEGLFHSHVSLFCVHDLSPYNQLLLFLLIRLQREAERSYKKRYKMQQKIEKLCSKNEAAASELKRLNRTATGRPSKEIDQPELLSTIVRVVEAFSAPDDRCRCEHLRSVKTLDDLHSELTHLGFNLSRSATYLRLLPRRSDSREEKRHVHTVKLKLVRPENSLRKKNPIVCSQNHSWMICLTCASCLSPNQCWFCRLTVKLE